MPAREIRRRFTKSEVVILGWRSREQASQLRRKFHKKPELDFENQSDSVFDDTAKRPRGSQKRKETDGVMPTGLPDRFFNKEGEVDLRQVSGNDVLKYFNAIGMPLPVIPRSNGK